MLPEHHSISVPAMPPLTNSEVIAKLNDEPRKNPTGAGKRAVVTRAFNQLGTEFLRKALRAVTAFDDFTAANDPHGERACATLTVDGTEVLFKTDCYDVDGLYASEDVSDPAQTLRVLTLLLPGDY